MTSRDSFDISILIPMLRFAILTHDHPHPHWDLLLEQEGQDRLRAWRLERPPAPGERFRAEALPDHRRVYLDYEGPISQGRGEVTRLDAGEYETLSESPTEIALRFEGQRTQGTATLRCDELGAWTFSQA